MLQSSESGGGAPREQTFTYNATLPGDAAIYSNYKKNYMHTYVSTLPAARHKNGRSRIPNLGSASAGTTGTDPGCLRR